GGCGGASAPSAGSRSAARPTARGAVVRRWRPAPTVGRSAGSERPAAVTAARRRPRLGDRGALVRPGPLGLELGGQREQGRLVAEAADDLHGERQAISGGTSRELQA